MSDLTSTFGSVCLKPLSEFTLHGPISGRAQRHANPHDCVTIEDPQTDSHSDDTRCTDGEPLLDAARRLRRLRRQSKPVLAMATTTTIMIAPATW